MKTLRILILLATVALLFSTCKKDSTPDCIQGNGNQVQESRTVGNFNGIVANGAFDLSISQINNSGVDLFGDSNVLPIITTATSNNILTVSVQNNQCYSTTKNIEVTATAPVISSIALNGAGKIDAYNLITDELLFETNGSATLSSSFDVNKLHTIINGTGNANLSGTADYSHFSITGTGSILASTVETDTCEIIITGVGDVRISVSKFLEVTISGSGNVYYTGDPETVNEYITGTGQVIKEG